MSAHSSADSHYPNHFEKVMTTKGGVDILIRPIKPEDAPLMEAFFKSLSDRTLYNRFFTLLKSFESKMLAEFTQLRRSGSMKKMRIKSGLTVNLEP